MSEEYTLRIAPEGVDARTATAKELSLGMDHPSLKVKARQNPKHFDTIPYKFESEPAVGTTNLLVLEHGYKYRPTSLCQFSDDAETYDLLPAIYEVDVPSGVLKQFRCNCDDKYLYIFLRREGASANLNGRTFYFKYSIYADAPD